MKTTNEIFEMTNGAIVEKYPFVALHDWRDNSISIEGTWLDAIPVGWLMAFGKMMCDEIYEVATEQNVLDDLRTIEIKEKYGELRWTLDGATQEINDIIDKYAALSTGICITCGRPDVRTTRGWITPICYECWSKTRLGIMSKESYVQCTDMAKMPSSMSYRQYDTRTDKWVVKKTNITRTANAIRDTYRWRVAHE